MNPSKAELLMRPIIGIENRTAQEVFDIMCDRFKALPDEPAPSPAPDDHIAGVGKMIAPSPTKPEGLEWRGNDLWVKVGRVRQEKPAPADPEGGYWWSVLHGSETGPIVGIEPAKALTEDRARSWLPPVSDPTDTVSVKREDAEWLEKHMLAASEESGCTSFFWAVKSRLRASLNGGADV